MLTLITGGARSGKSSFAQSFGRCTDPVTYIATARNSDSEMAERIARHRECRPAGWITVEEPLALPEVVANHAGRAGTIIVDCLTLWLSNTMFERRLETPAAVESFVRSEAGRLIAACENVRVVAVTNEVGSGIVPESPVARLFRDLQGTVNSELAREADAVYLMACGLPLQIKPACGCHRELAAS